MVSGTEAVSARLVLYVTMRHMVGSEDRIEEF